MIYSKKQTKNKTKNKYSPIPCIWYYSNHYYQIKILWLRTINFRLTIIVVNGWSHICDNRNVINKRVKLKSGSITFVICCNKSCRYCLQKNKKNKNKNRADIYHMFGETILLIPFHSIFSLFSILQTIPFHSIFFNHFFQLFKSLYNIFKSQTIYTTSKFAKSNHFSNHFPNYLEW